MAVSQKSVRVTHPYMQTLTPLQKHVLYVLANRDASPSDCGAWYPLTTTQARGVIDRLYAKGIVKPVRFEGRSRIFRLTDLGWQFAQYLEAEAEDELAEL
jgi:DNA-binding MarR family transcriptional regulator